MKNDTTLVPQKELAAHFGVSTNALRSWGLPSVRTSGRERLYDPGLCTYLRLGHRVAEARKLDVSGQLQEFAVGFVSSREVGGKITPADVKSFIKFGERADLDSAAALIALGEIARVLGVKVLAG